MQLCFMKSSLVLFSCAFAHTSSNPIAPAVFMFDTHLVTTLPVISHSGTHRHAQMHLRTGQPSYLD